MTDELKGVVDLTIPSVHEKARRYDSMVEKLEQVIRVEPLNGTQVVLQQVCKEILSMLTKGSDSTEDKR